MSVELPGTPPFLPGLLSAAVEPVVPHVLLLSIVAGNKNLILRTTDEDVALVARWTALALHTIFGYSVHRARCRAGQTPSDFLRALLGHRRASVSPADADPRLASTDTSLSSAHFRNASPLPSAVVVSGLELASLASQKALLRTLADGRVIVSDKGVFGHDHPGLALDLPDGFFVVYVCRSDSRERPPIYTSLLDRFAMSSSVDIGPQSRMAIRQYRPPSFPPAALSSPSSAAFPASRSLNSLSGPPQPLAHPVIPPALIQQLKHLCATRVHIRPPLSIYLADLFTATRHYGSLDAMMLTVRARRDAEALVRANRVLGADRTGAELINAYAERSRETTSISTHPYSHNSVAHVSSDGLMEGSDAKDTYEPLNSVNHQSEPEPVELDVSEADIARVFPRVVSHRIRVRDSPFDQVLSSAVCGAVGEDEQGVEWERETVKDILVHILAEV